MKFNDDNPLPEDPSIIKTTEIWWRNQPGHEDDQQIPEIKIMDLLKVASDTLQTVVGADNVSKWDLLVCPHDFRRYEGELQVNQRFTEMGDERIMANLKFKAHRVLVDESIERVNKIKVKERNA